MTDTKVRLSLRNRTKAEKESIEILSYPAFVVSASAVCFCLFPVYRLPIFEFWTSGGKDLKVIKNHDWKTFFADVQICGNV